jgi:hypothetical protein
VVVDVGDAGAATLASIPYGTVAMEYSEDDEQQEPVIGLCAP